MDNEPDRALTARAMEQWLSSRDAGVGHQLVVLLAFGLFCALVGGAGGLGSAGAGEFYRQRLRPEWQADPRITSGSIGTIHQ